MLSSFLLLGGCFPELGDAPGTDSAPLDDDDRDDNTDEAPQHDEDPQDSDPPDTEWEWSDTGTCVAYPDADGDGWGTKQKQLIPCDMLGLGWAPRSGDCDDTNGAVHPEADEVCNGIDDDCDSSADSQEACNGCPVHPGPDGRPYAFCTETSNWAKAYEACASMTSYHLVTIGDEAEQAFVWDASGRISSGSWWWLGYHNKHASNGHEPDRSWEWIDGVESDYTNWAHGQPDDAGDGEDCGHMYGYDGYWNDLPCDDSDYGGTPLYFICEASPG